MQTWQPTEMQWTSKGQQTRQLIWRGLVHKKGQLYHHICEYAKQLLHWIHPRIRSSGQLLRSTQKPTPVLSQCLGQGHWLENWYICFFLPNTMEETHTSRGEAVNSRQKRTESAKVWTTEPPCFTLDLLDSRHSNRRLVWGCDLRLALWPKPHIFPP